MKNFIIKHRHAILIIAAFVSGFTLSPCAKAEGIALLINGRSIHLEEPDNGREFNEHNQGWGLHYDFKTTENGYVPFVSASGMIDSYNSMAHYVGGGFMKRFPSTNSDWHLDLGVMAFLMSKQREFDCDKEVFVGALPVASVGNKYAAVNMTFVPAVKKEHVPTLFFQLKIPLQH